MKKIIKTIKTGFVSAKNPSAVYISANDKEEILIHYSDRYESKSIKNLTNFLNGLERPFLKLVLEKNHDGSTSGYPQNRSFKIPDMAKIEGYPKELLYFFKPILANEEV